MVLRLLCITFLALSYCYQGLAQEQKPGRDSIIGLTTKEPPHKTIVGKFIHKLIFKSNIREINYDQKYLNENPIPFRLVEGKIIRTIHITTIDPFGYSLQDTSVHPVGFTKKLGNTLHINTRRKVISNLILIRPNEPFDSLLFKESERLIRAQKYVQDVLTYTSVNSPQDDSIDVHIRVVDVWSIVPKLRISDSNLELGLADNNFMGLGNRLHIDTRMNDNILGAVTQVGYMIPNIRNSHITGSIEYYFPGNNDLINNTEFKRPLYSPTNSNLPTLYLSNRHLVKSIELSRPFFSPLARWAGGIFMGQLVTRQNYVDNDSVRYLSAKTNIQDLWAAWSWPLSKANTLAARTTSLVVSGRMLRTRYPDRMLLAETVNIFNKENFYFAGLGITSRKYIQDRYIFNYGKVEDIPIGRSFGITTGLNKQGTNQFYLGLNAAWGDNYPFGYLSSHFEYGTYIYKKGFHQQVITGRMNYYTRLFSIGYWKVRQFIKPTVIIGINRLPTDNLTLNEGMVGFEELNTPAIRMMVLTLQTQSYAPWEIYGFRFGPYIYSSLGMLGHQSPAISNKRLYSILGLGVLIKNNYLLINTFQVSLTFYPFLPGEGYNILNLNAYKTSDFGFHGFEISRPQVVDYR